MAKLTGNEQMCDGRGRPLRSLAGINALSVAEKERIYGSIIPSRLFTMFGISSETFCGTDGIRRVRFIAPDGLGLARLELRYRPGDHDTVFFLDIADTHFGQMELSFCIISDPVAARFNVDVDMAGQDNAFGSLGRNLPEEERAMAAGLFPNQTRRGLRLFSAFFPLFERFVDALGMEMIVAEPLTYDNAIRYEGYGFDYLTGRHMMQEINEGFRPGGQLTRRLDNSTPFRESGMERYVRGRSWAIHDGILGRPWDGVQIYKMIGVHAGIDTFPERENENSDH
jgi:hypothetical protein